MSFSKYMKKKASLTYILSFKKNRATLGALIILSDYLGDMLNDIIVV